MQRAVRPDIFRNRWATFRGILLFPSQSVGTDIPVPFAQFYFDQRMGPVIFPAICRWTLFTNNHFFSLFLFLSFRSKWHLRMYFRCKSAGRISTRNTSRFLWQKQKQEFRYGTSARREISKKKHCQQMNENEMQTSLCGWKTFTFDADYL